MPAALNGQDTISRNRNDKHASNDKVGLIQRPDSQAGRLSHLAHFGNVIGEKSNPLNASASISTEGSDIMYFSQKSQVAVKHGASAPHVGVIAIQAILL